MLDRRRRTDLEGVQALGRLSDEMVFSLGRTLREEVGARLPDEDLHCFAAAATLFELLASDAATIPDSPDGMMFSPSGYLDALHAVQGRAEGERPEEYASEVAHVLRTVIDRGAIAEDERPILESLRELFAEVGEVTLSRAGELSLPQEAHWPPMRQAI